MRLRLFYLFIYLITLNFPHKLNASESKVNFELNTNENNTLLESNLYLIDSGDVIKIDFFGDEELNSEYLVMSDGMIYLPYVKPISLRGLTINQSRVKIEEIYSRELLIPQINIAILKRRPLRISVIGEVQRPGLHVLNENQNIGVKPNGNMLTVLDAIQAAGGITKDANLKNVSLIRKIPGVNERRKKTYLDLAQLILEGNQIFNPFLFDGDIIEIEKAKNYNSNIVSLSKSTISPSEIKIDVIGEVNNPGEKILKPNSTLNQAILRAGGIKTLEANRNNINLVRINENGTMISKRFKFSQFKQLSKVNNPLLLDGDIVIVNSSSLQKISKGISFITKPLSGLVTAVSVFKLVD